jgi:hypothetical protein
MNTVPRLQDRERVMSKPGWRPWLRWDWCTDSNGVRFRRASPDTTLPFFAGLIQGLYRDLWG